MKLLAMSHWKDGACGACAIGNSIEIHRNFGSMR